MKAGQETPTKKKEKQHKEENRMLPSLLRGAAFKSANGKNVV